MKLFSHGYPILPANFYRLLTPRSDFSPATTFYFWFLDKAKLHASLLESVYQTVYKLRARRSHEFEQDKLLVDLASLGAAQIIDNAGEAEKLQKLTAVFNRIDQAILQVDLTGLVLGVF